MVHSTKNQERPLYDMFNSVPPRYDRVNSVITWGMDRGWRRAAARECLAGRPARVLDLACGTGDLAVNLARLGPESLEITALDYSEPMLDLARKKAAHLPGRKPAFVQGDAAALPFPDGQFDAVGISFAFRNLTYKNPLAPAFLSEVLRVLSPGGRFVIVETSQPESGLIRKLFHLYLRIYVRRVGSLVSQNRGAYTYLAASAARFYNAAEIRTLLTGAGFREVKTRYRLFGAVAVYTAFK